MWKLFKETFKSLKKNKVTVIGLTILVFLSSAIFTLLYDVSKSMSQQYNEYKKESKLHDLTLDLNIPSSGNAYNNGFLVNGLSKERQEHFESYEKPLIYKAQNKNLVSKYIINLEVESGKYIKLQNIGVSDDKFKDLYFDKNDFYDIFKFFNISEVQSTVKFELNPKSKSFVKFLKDYNIETYENKNNEFVKSVKNNQINLTDSIRLDKEYKFSDIFRSRTLLDDKTIFTDPSTLFINLETKEATFDFVKGRGWDDLNRSYKVPVLQLANAFGLIPSNESNTIFKFDSSKTPSLLNAKLDLKNQATATLKNEVKLSDLSKEKVGQSIDNLYTFVKNKEYNLPKNYIAKEEILTSYQRWNYTSSYKNELKEKWSGSYKTFMDFLISSNENKIPSEINDFSHWNIEISTYQTNHDDKGNELKNNLMNVRSNILSFEDVTKTKLYFDALYQPKHVDSKLYKYDGFKTIFEIEKLSKINDAILQDINDNELKEKRYLIIKNGALKITKESITNKVIEKVGRENLGLRKTITIDAVDAITNKKQVFHFINVGDSKNRIDGIDLNVGKLYNEQKNPTALNGFTDINNSYFKTKELPIYVGYVLIKNAPFNLTPNPDLTLLDYSYESVKFINPISKEVEIKNGAKVYKLTNFLNDNNHKDINKFNNFGIVIDQLNFAFVHYNDKNEVKWETIVTDKRDKLFWNAEEVLEYLRQNKWTLKVLKINDDGWVEFDKTFKNIAYLPLGFRSPKPQIVNEALNNDTLVFAFKQIQNTLLNSSFVKEGILSPESIYSFIETAIKSTENGLVAKIFKTAKMNMSEVVENAFTFMYDMSHTPNGDNLTNLIDDILEGIKKKVSDKKDIAAQKAYLEEQLGNLFNFMGELATNPLVKNLDPRTLVSASKEPLKFLESISKIVKSISFKDFTQEIYNFITSKEYNKIVKYEGADRKIKFSNSQLLIWFFKHIDEKLLKEGINEIIDNLDTKAISNFEDPNSLLSVIVRIFSEKIQGSIKNLLKSVDANPNDPNKSYTNLTNGLKQLINSLNIKLMIKTMESKLVLRPFDQTLSAYDYVKNETITQDFQYLAYSISNHDIFYSVLKSLFEVEGSNKAIKDTLISMFNLSDKGISIKVDDKTNIVLPSADNEKIDFFDLVALATSASAESSIQEKNSITLSNFEETYSTIFRLNKKIDEIGTITVDHLSSKEKLIATDILNIDLKSNDFDKEIKQKVKNALEIIKIFEFNNNVQKYQNDSSLGNLGKFYFDFKNTTTGNSLWNTAFNFMKEVLKYNPTNQFSYGVDVYGLLKIWQSIYFEKGISNIEKEEFAKALLEFANSKEIIDEFNDFKLIQPSAENIALHKETGFGISSSLANPQAFSLEFFREESMSFKNQALNKFVLRFPKFKKWIVNNEFELTKTFSYIASSNMYYFYSQDEINSLNIKSGYKNLHSIIIENFLNGIMKREIVTQNIDIFENISTLFPSNNAINSIGISDVLLNPVLRQFFPQVLIWTLSDTNNKDTLNTKNRSNLAYFLIDKVINFEDILNRGEKETYRFIANLSKEHIINPIFESELAGNIAFNNDFFINLLNSEKNKKGEFNVFGVNLAEFLISIIDSITTIDYSTSSYKFDEPSAYVAKANYAYLSKNNKTIYTGELPKTPTEINELIANLDEKFLLNVNGLKFIILGDEITTDYLYPVIDENNIQVDTSSQALVYVNQNGFDRARFAYQGNNVKEYLLIKSPDKESIPVLEEELEKFVSNNIDDTANLRRVYDIHSIDPLNPERSVRINVIDGIIKSVDSVSTILLSLLISLVAISIIFIIKRYINNKNKVIGILLAQGYSPFQISASFTVFAFVTALIGGTLGYLLGFLLQGPTIRILDNYWTLPIITTSFSWFSFVFTLILPFIGMSLLIFVVSLWALRYKSIDLMSGITEVQTGDLYQKYHSKFRRKKITTKFGASLIFNSFWKLWSFALSVILTAITTIFGISTFGVFDKSITKTYENRAYKYKYDLQTPTLEGGALIPYNPGQMQNSLYVTQGLPQELKRNNFDYFKPGFSSVLNAGYQANGTPDTFTPHIITQFSINLKVDSGVSVDPWSIAYNSMPDTQKSRITLLRNKIGVLLEKTQNGLVYDKKGNLDLNNSKHTFSYFRYDLNDKSPLDSKFVYMLYNKDSKKHDEKIITTSAFRSEYRNFLVNGYTKLYKEGKESDFFIGFGGILFDPKYDEGYTYAQGLLGNSKINFYGYKKDSTQVKLIDSSGYDLLEELYSDQHKDRDYIPLVINEVVSKKFNLGIGSEIESKILNTTDRFTNKFKALINNSNSNKDLGYKFRVVGINPTYINYEFIIPKYIADKITGLDKLSYPGEAFNGILSKSEKPEQLIGSTALYSVSGYWPAFSSFDLTTVEKDDKLEIFDNLFGRSGILIKNGYTQADIAKFLSPTVSSNYEKAFSTARNTPDEFITKYAQIFDNSLYIPPANSIIASDIEIGFTQTISHTVQIIVTSVIILSFIVSSIILIIVSSILISENEKNIAIWTILGYSQKEKLKMFFGIFIPFIFIALLIAIPLALLLIKVFALFLISTAAISVPISLGFFNIVLTFIVIISIFTLTSLLSWRRINKIKAVDLLKGK
ncbi:ABC transporter permease [Mycoplasmopsis alligatoris]|uniref:Efflux ABC transporter, permease protein n=1 Tax=Mycoplasmopsis alligatoris A21JP2 TaxID=747682 RepID=D4XWI0_9BACT|nr:ABC transporter permease [Mycoplasmopsis alligatoris]EFF41341.1 efflux ABC transporter, permease protein [Mycoplasmopsis alligatoris A21JP2]